VGTEFLVSREQETWWSPPPHPYHKLNHSLSAVQPIT